MSGLVEQLELKTDNSESLEHAIAICMKWNSRVSSFYVTEENGLPWMHLCWGDGKDQKLGVNFFPAPLENPKMVTDQVWSWLQAQFKDQKSGCKRWPGFDTLGDGTDSPGFYFKSCHDFSGAKGVYPFIKVSPYYIYYSK
jgi:hypothetical protein